MRFGLLHLVLTSQRQVIKADDKEIIIRDRYNIQLTVDCLNEINEHLNHKRFDEVSFTKEFSLR